MKNIIHSFLAVLCLFFANSALAQQDITIKGVFKNNEKYAFAKLVSFSGMQEQALAQEKILENGVWALNLPAATPPGIYRLYYSQIEENRYFDIIVNGEKNIAFTIDVDKDIRTPEFTASEENKAWYNYIVRAGMLHQKQQYLYQFAVLYPEKSDKIYKEVRKSLSAVQKEQQKLNDAFIKANKGTIAGAMVQNRPLLFINPDAVLLAQQYELLENFWSGIDTHSEILLNTPLYTDLIIEYLSIYMQVAQRYNEQELEQGFRDAADKIVGLFDKDDSVKQQVINYLTLGFKEIGQEGVLQYIDENYGSQCTNKDADFEKRMSGYKALRTGMPAPDVNLGGLTLSNIPGEKLIVAFWAGWCSHCLEEMPRLNAEIAKYNGVSIAAISLDTEQQSYSDVSEKLDNMMHFYDGKGWESEAAEKFYVVATPTFFLLDKERNIIDKFSSVETLLKGLD